MLPSCMTKIRSAFLMVERRCAIMNEVRFLVSLSMALWMNCSVRASTLDVASSKIIMGGSAIMARAMVRSCFSPAETISESSSIFVLYELGRDSII